jgi:hypothetical protein
MLDDRLVFAKTAKGIAEVNARSGVVPLAVRRVLIMIDGRRTVADLAPLAQPGEIGSVVEHLEAQGLVHLAPAGAPTSLPGGAPQADASEDVSDDRLVASFEAVKRRAVRELSDRLGPDAEVIAVRIEHCRGTEDLRQRLQEAERLVAGMLGDAQAQDFLRSLRRR